MSNFAKKLFSGFVTFATILSTVFMGTLSFAGAASASSFAAGDLIKASTPAVYFYAADGKRYVFPNEKTYFSWYKDFSSVKTITDAELASVMIGGNVTIRQGTKLVKITTDPKVYAVTKGGALHWVETEAVAIALYGANWAKMVVDVPDGFFVNYSVGSSIPTAVHPDGSVITYVGSSSKYVVMNGQKRLISDAAFSANNLDAAYVLTTSVSYPNGSDVTGREAAIADVVAAGGSANVTPAAGTLSVALASDTAPQQTVAKNANSVPLFKFTVTGGTADTTLTGIKIHRVGIGATSDFSNVYLYDANGTRLTTGRTINSTSQQVEFNSLNVAIVAGQSKSLVLVGDFSAPSTSGGQHSFELSDASYVVLSSGTVSGSFPVRGNVITVGTQSAARVDIKKGTQPADVNVGSKDVEISNFKITANTNNTEIRRITLLQAGTITNTDLSNLKLYQGVNVIATAAALQNDKMVLNITSPFPIDAGITKTFSLHADVSGRTGRTIRTYVEYTTDVYAIDKLYNTGAQIDIGTNGSFDGATSADYIEINTAGSQLTFAFNGPSSANIAKGSTGVVMHKFSLTSSDNDLEIKQLNFMVTSTSGTGNAKVKGASGTEYFRNIRVVNLDTNGTIMGPTSMASTVASPATSTGIITFTEGVNIKSGQTLNLALVVDLAATEDADAGFYTPGINNYAVVMANSVGTLFSSTAVKLISTGEYLATAKIVPNSTSTGNNFTVKSSSLSVSLAGTPSSKSVVKKSANVNSAGFVFGAGAQSDVTVTAITVTGYGSTDNSTYAVGTFNSVVQACSLWDAAANKQVGTAKNPDATAGTMNFTGINWSVPKGTSKILEVHCDVSTNISSTNYYNVGIAASDVTAQDSDANSISSVPSTLLNTTSRSVVVTVLANGTLTVATESLAPATILVADGSTWRNLSQFKLTAQNEDLTVDRINVTSTYDAANYATIAIAKDGAVQGWDVLPAGSYKNKDIDLSGNPLTVPAGSSVSLQVWAKLANIQSSSSAGQATSGVARTGNQVSAGIGAGLQTGEWDSNYSGKFNIRATGKSSGTRIYGSSSATYGTVGNVFVMRKSKPVVTKQALSSTTLASGVDMDLYKMNVAADANGAISLKKITYNVTFTTSTNSTVTLSNFRIRRGSSDLASSAVSIYMATSTETVNAPLNLYTGTLSPAANGRATGTVPVTVVFTSEETISGSGNVYTLHATVNGTVIAGDAVSVSLRRNNNTTPVTGYLTASSVTSTVSGAIVVGPQIDTTQGAGDGTEDVTANARGTGTFVWSDQSEVPHSDSTAANGGSFDWTEDMYVDDVTATQVVSR